MWVLRSVFGKMIVLQIYVGVEKDIERDENQVVLG